MRVTAMTERAVLVAPAPFGGGLRAPQVAAAIGRGLEAAGVAPPEAGGTALVEPAGDPARTAGRLAAAAAAGPAVVVLAAADVGAGHAAEAVAHWRGRPRLVVLT